MLNIKEVIKAVEQIADEKSLESEQVIGVVEDALAAAYKKEYVEKGSIVRARLDQETGELEFWRVKEVVDPDEVRIVEEDDEDDEGAEDEEASEKKFSEEAEGEQGESADVEESDDEEEVEQKESEEEQLTDENEEKDDEDEEDYRPRYNPARHIFLEEAKEHDPDAEVGAEIIFPLEPQEDFGRIAAQVAKQTIIQKVREAERTSVLDEWRGKEGEVVSGIVQRVERGHTYVDFGRAVGVMFANESIPGEHYRQGERLRFLVLAVQEDAKLPGIILSRAHPDFVERLFEMEVPEIAEGIVEIKEIAREAGSRTKLAVISNDESVDPIGACVGQRGTRVMAVNNEVGKEKIDIIEWSDEPEQYVAHSLSPAEVEAVEMLPRRTVRVYVPEDQLSLAIGRGGQNVRMAAKLTGWKIDVRSQTRPEEVQEGGVADMPDEEADSQDTENAPENTSAQDSSTDENTEEAQSSAEESLADEEANEAESTEEMENEAKSAKESSNAPEQEDAEASEEKPAEETKNKQEEDNEEENKEEAPEK